MERRWQKPTTEVRWCRRRRIGHTSCKRTGNLFTPLSCSAPTDFPTPNFTWWCSWACPRSRPPRTQYLKHVRGYKNPKKPKTTLTMMIIIWPPYNWEPRAPPSLTSRHMNLPRTTWRWLSAFLMTPPAQMAKGETCTWKFTRTSLSRFSGRNRRKSTASSSKVPCDTSLRIARRWF